MEFTKYKLNELGTVYSGGTPSTKNAEYWDGNIPWITPKDLSGYKRKYISSGERSITELGLQNSSAILIPKRSVLMSSRAPIGYVVINENEVTTNQGFKSINCNEDKCLNEYMYYWIKNNVDYITSKSNGSTFKEISGTSFKELIAKVPSLVNQAKIVNILGKIDKKIELNSEINNNLLELSKLLYMNTFSDNSDFEEIKLGELCNIKYGKGLPTTKILDNGYPVYGGNGIIGYYDSKMYDESQVLISCRGAVSGKVILSKPNSFVTNNSLILEIDRLYHHYLKEYCFLNPFYAYTTGSAQPQITIDNIKDIIVKIPDSKTLEEFNCKCEAIEKNYFLNIEQNETLEQLRDTLLPKLMNGEIDLDNIEI